MEGDDGAFIYAESCESKSDDDHHGYASDTDRADREMATMMSMTKTSAGFGEATRVWSTLLAVGGGLARGRGTVKRRYGMD